MDTNIPGRWQDWLHAAKERAYAMERLAPLAEYRPRRARATENANPTWYEPNPMRYPVQDGNMLVKGIVARRAKPTKFFRSFHGKAA